MPIFAYVARDQQGLAHSGELDGMSEDDVVALLQRRGLLVTSISRKDLVKRQQLTTRRDERRMHQRVTIDDQVLLCQELATLVEAGVPLLRSLEVVSAQVESRTLLRALEDVHHDVGAGSTLVGAFAKHPAVFSKLWVNLAETGEASGHLAQSLQHLSRHLESIRHIRTQMHTALTYPLFLAAVAALVSAVFVYWLIPRFSLIFSALGQARLPVITRIVIAISDAARHYLIPMAFAVAGLGFFARRYLRSEPGQWVRDRLLLSLPLVRTLTRHAQFAEFARGLSTLLESGVPLLSSLEILEDSATNKIYGRAFRAVREHVKEGKTMAEPMAATGAFPPMVIQMVQVGEEIGELAKMADRIATHYEERVTILIARMTRLFEPIAILVIAVIVLFVVLAMFLPIFEMAGGAGVN